MFLKHSIKTALGLAISFFLMQTTLAQTSTSATRKPAFADHPAALAFSKDMEFREGFNADELMRLFSSINSNPKVIQLIKPPSTPGQRSWERYRSRFLNERRIDGGIKFWQNNKNKLLEASQRYGVPPEIIVAIIGVETEYGKNTGGFKVLEALATLAFEYPPRAEFFRKELEQFLLMARESGISPLDFKGSYAGAIGIPQFMPGSQRRFAVDFDNDGKIDLSNSTDDAIGSVARFLEQHGWQAGGAIAFPAQLTQAPATAWLEAGIRPTLEVSELKQQGVSTSADSRSPVALIDLVTPGMETEYWLGLNNFYVITRYNRSSFYAMSVFQLAEAIREKRLAGSSLR